MDTDRLRKIASNIRMGVIEMSHSAGTPHLGSSLSCIDILTALYWSVLKDRSAAAGRSPARSLHPEQGARGAGSCTSLWRNVASSPKRCLENLQSRRRQTWPSIPGPRCVPGIEAATGSLGHGLSLGVGMALAGRIKKQAYRVFAAAQRRRMQRRLCLGGGHDGSRAEARQSRHHRRLQQVASHRPQQRDAQPRSAGRQVGGVRLADATKSTATILASYSMRLRQCPPAPASRWLSSLTPSRDAASPSWKTITTGTIEFQPQTKFSKAAQELLVA